MAVALVVLVGVVMTLMVGHTDSGVLVELALACDAHHSEAELDYLDTEKLSAVEVLVSHSSASHAPVYHVPIVGQLDPATRDESDILVHCQVVHHKVQWMAELDHSLPLLSVPGFASEAMAGLTT
jgi:hypothetical protein